MFNPFLKLQQHQQNLSPPPQASGKAYQHFEFSGSFYSKIDYKPESWVLKTRNLSVAIVAIDQ